MASFNWAFRCKIWVFAGATFVCSADALTFTALRCCSKALKLAFACLYFASTSSNAQAAHLNYLSKNSELSYAKYKAKASLKNAQNNYKTSLAKIEAAKAKLQASEMTYELVKKKFQQGIVNNVSFLDALSDKFNSNSQLQTALNEAEYQKAVLLYEMGENIKGAIQWKRFF